MTPGRVLWLCPTGFFGWSILAASIVSFQNLSFGGGGGGVERLFFFLKVLYVLRESSEN